MYIPDSGDYGLSLDLGFAVACRVLLCGMNFNAASLLCSNWYCSISVILYTSTGGSRLFGASMLELLQILKICTN